MHAYVLGCSRIWECTIKGGAPQDGNVFPILGYCSTPPHLLFPSGCPDRTSSKHTQSYNDMLDGLRFGEQKKKANPWGQPDQDGLVTLRPCSPFGGEESPTHPQPHLIASFRRRTHPLVCTSVCGCCIKKLRCPQQPAIKTMAGGGGAGRVVLLKGGVCYIELHCGAFPSHGVQPHGPPAGQK
jgi:hypothetical protein